MAGKIIADTIETGAGADISTSYVVNGSAKAWAAIDPNVIDESFNIASLTDQAGGDFDYNFTSLFTNVDYSTSGSKQNTSNNDSDINALYTLSSSSATRQRYFESSTTLRDPVNANVTVHGDLA